jgi:hypothetical protein
MKHNAIACWSCSIGPFPNRTIRTEDKQLILQSANPIRDLAKLADTEIDPRWIELERPQLEDVFLNLTGRRLRDS